MLRSVQWEGVEALLGRLCGVEASAVLDRLASGDPLGLGPRCARAIRREGYMMDPSRVLEAALVGAAFELSLGAVESDPDAWLEERVQRAIEHILRQDEEWVRGGDGGARHADEVGPGAFLVSILAVERERADEAAVRFQYLPKRARRRFFALVIDAWSLAKTAEWFGGNAREIADDLWEGLHLMGLATEDQREGMLDELLRLDNAREALR